MLFLYFFKDYVNTFNINGTIRKYTNHLPPLID